MAKTKVTKNKLLLKDTKSKTIISKSSLSKKKIKKDVVSNSTNDFLDKSMRKHIVKRESGWAIKQEGASRASKIYPKKDDAIEAARKYLEKGFEIIIHKKDGSIEEWLKSKKSKQ